jgi:hypothetical protein
MHFRLRKNVVQLVRTLYNPETKKPRTVIVGRMPLGHPKLTQELKKKLTEDEIAEAEAWIDGQFRLNSLKDELAALTLAESISAANRWFSRNEDNPAATAIALQLLPAFKTLRRMLRGKGLLG